MCCVFNLIINNIMCIFLIHIRIKAAHSSTRIQGKHNVNTIPSDVNTFANAYVNYLFVIKLPPPPPPAPPPSQYTRLDIMFFTEHQGPRLVLSLREQGGL